MNRLGVAAERTIVPLPRLGTDITKDRMRAAFAAYAPAHEPASIRRCWSTWNVLCAFLHTAELIPANPMAFVSKPKAAKTLPRSTVSSDWAGFVRPALMGSEVSFAHRHQTPDR